MRLFPVLVPVEEDRKGLLDHEMMRKSGLLQIAEGLREREHGLDDSWKELYRWFVKDEQSQETLKQMIEAGFYRKDEPSLGSRVAKELFLDPKRVSVTRLERFCFLCICTFPELRTPSVRTGEIWVRSNGSGKYCTSGTGAICTQGRRGRSGLGYNAGREDGSS